MVARRNSLIKEVWGLSPKLLLWIYKAIVRPMLSYAAIIWWPRCKLLTVQAQLPKLQRQALIGITGAMRSTPTAALEVLLDVEPLHLYIEEIARNTAMRLNKTNLLIKTNQGHAKIWDIMVKENPLFSMPQEAITRSCRFDRTFEVLILSRESWFNETQQLLNHTQVWLTDGSKTNFSSGAGGYCENQHSSTPYTLGKHATVPQTELVGILNCCLEITQQGEINTPICICSDSQGVLKILRGWKFNTALALECRNQIQGLSSKTRTTLLWVPGHSGIE